MLKLNFHSFIATNQTRSSTEMAILTVEIPDDVKKRCESLFIGHTIEEMLAQLLEEALEQESVHRRTKAAVDRLLTRRAATKPVSAESIQAARLAGRS